MLPLAWAEGGSPLPGVCRCNQGIAWCSLVSADVIMSLSITFYFLILKTWDLKPIYYSVVVLSVECYQSLQGSHHAALSDCFGFGGVAVRLVSLHSSSLQMIVVYKILVVFVLVVVPLLLGWWQDGSSCQIKAKLNHHQQAAEANVSTGTAYPLLIIARKSSSHHNFFFFWESSSQHNCWD